MPPRGSRRRVVDGDRDGLDRLSGLPEDLLLQILASLRSNGAAVLTGALSRRWRDLWTALPEWAFHDAVDPGWVESVLAQVTRPALDVLDVHFEKKDICVKRHALSSLLLAAARLAPKKLALSCGDWGTNEDGGDVNLPCLDRTVSLEIQLWETPLAPPLSGEFTALQKLTLLDCEVDLAVLLPLCPRLRVLIMERCIAPFDAVVHSPSLEELVLNERGSSCLIDIVAPALKKVKVKVYMDEPLRVSLLVPMVEQSKWCLVFDDWCVDFGDIWLMLAVYHRVVGKEPPCLNVELKAYPDLPYHREHWSFEQAIAQLPVTNFSVLDLDIIAYGHIFGPLVLHMLQIRPDIQRLNMLIYEEETLCSVDCPCQQPNNWGRYSVALINLEEVQVVGVIGRDDEFDLLRLLFRCAPVLRRMSVKFCDSVPPNETASNKFCSFFEEYPNVECLVHRNCDKWEKPSGNTVGSTNSGASAS